MNGYIRLIDKMEEGGFNEWGEPIESVPVWGEPIPCLYSTITDNIQGVYEDGKARLLSFYITVGINATNRQNRVQLYDKDNYLICEKEIQSIEISTLMGRTKITV